MSKEIRVKTLTTTFKLAWLFFVPLVNYLWTPALMQPAPILSSWPKYQPENRGKVLLQNKTKAAEAGLGFVQEHSFCSRKGNSFKPQTCPEILFCKIILNTSKYYKLIAILKGYSCKRFANDMFFPVV